MKFLTLSAALLLTFSTLTQAAPRAFRVEKIGANKYATAFGFKGELVDFEAVERTGTVGDLVDQHWDKGTFCNYVVDILHDQILSESCGDFVDATFGGSHYGNHYSYNLSVMSVTETPRDWSATHDLLIESSSVKWFGGISAFRVAKRSEGLTEIVASCEGDCVSDLMNNISSKLSQSERELMDELGANYFELEEIENSDFTRAIKFVNTFYRPKSEDSQELEVTPLIVPSLENGVLKLSLESVKTKIIE